MVSNAFTAPHVTRVPRRRVTPPWRCRKDQLKGSREFADVKLTPLAFVAKAVCLAAARATPAVNASWDERAGEIVYYEHVRLGIAAATPAGLVVPKIPRRRPARPARAGGRAGQLTETAPGRPDSARGHSSAGRSRSPTIGVFGVDSGTPILNQASRRSPRRRLDQTGAVGGGRRAGRPHSHRLALSFDHRVVDGARLRFLAAMERTVGGSGVAFTW
ncbi:2-oxo acid dehydrogenase subunit E2 [Pseudonocardia sp. MCCB 268]|nr:2-oxo acid dehydrogenase subunit E2 [Pseudonocardia cytotoxica]